MTAGFELLDPGLVTTVRRQYTQWRYTQWRSHPAEDGGDRKDDILVVGVGVKR